MTHNCNLRHNPLVANNEENNVSDPQTFDLIINLEKKILPRFDALDKELLNLKGVHKRSPSWKPVLKVRMKVNNIENKVMSLEIIGNHLKQYGRRNNLEITGIPWRKWRKPGRKSSPSSQRDWGQLLNFGYWSMTSHW